MLLNSDEARKLLSDEGIVFGLGFSDRNLHTITATDVQRVFQSFVESLPSKLLNRVSKLPHYLSETYDCENHAYELMVAAARANAVTTLSHPQRKKGGVALGVLFYHSKGTSGGRIGPHAINIFIDHRRNIRFFEPADGKIIVLTEIEKESSWNVRFI